MDTSTRTPPHDRPWLDLPGWARVVLGPVSVWALGWLALGLLLAGSVVATDCFIGGGDDPRPWLGVPLAGLAAVPAVAGLRTVVWTVSPSAAGRVGGRVWATLAGGAGGALAGAVLVQATSLEQVVPGGAGLVLVAGAVLLAPRLWSVLRALDDGFDDLRPRSRRAWLVALWVAGGVAVAATAWLGHCAAFGGRCPAVPGPFWEDEVWHATAAVSAGVAVGHLLLARRTRSVAAWLAAAAGSLVASLVAWALTLA